MCVGCAITAASAATGTRSWIAAHRPDWIDPRRMRAITLALLGAAGIVSTVGFSGSTPPTHAQPPATAGRIVSSAPSGTGVASPSRKRMSSPARYTLTNRRSEPSSS